MHGMRVIEDELRQVGDEDHGLEVLIGIVVGTPGDGVETTTVTILSLAPCKGSAARLRKF